MLSALLRRPGGTMELFPAQEEALAAIACEGGLLGVIGVGYGKTLIAALAPTVAGAARPLILCPSPLVEQTRSAIAEYSRHWRVVEGIEVMGYGLLSSPRGKAELAKMSPDLVILDEGHYLKSAKAARTKRVRAMLRRTGARVVVMSGTMTQRSVRDYTHLAYWALGDRSPMPHDWPTMARWSRCLDASSWEAPSGADYARTARELGCSSTDQEDLRAALRARLAAHDGVVLTEGDGVRARLHLEEMPITVPAEVRDALASLEDAWELEGQGWADAMHVEATRRRVIQGFFYRWRWQPDRAWLDARRGWLQEVTAYLGHAGRYDTEGLVRDACAAVKAPTAALRDAWEAWEPHHKTKAPPTDVVWLSRYLVEHATRWAQSVGGVVWYHDTAAIEGLEAAGLECVRSGTRPPMDGRPLGLSVRGHGTGLDGLQHHYAASLYLCPLSSVERWEQSLGRIHRTGQAADHVHAYHYQTSVHAAALATAEQAAHYIHETTQQRPRILFAARS